MSRISKYSAATLTVTLKEELTIDDRDFGGIQTISIPSIKDVTKRIVSITTTEVQILSFGAAAGKGTYIVGDVQYLRFTNLDDTNHIVLTISNENDDEVALKLDKGHSLAIVGDVAGGMADMMDAKDSALSLSLGDFKSITADADTATCDLEIYIASS